MSYERVILDANDTAAPLVTTTPTLSSTPVPTPNPSISMPSPSTSTSVPSTSTSVPVITNVQPTPVASHPKCNTCLPVRDNDPRYSVSSYNQPSSAEQANVILTDETDNLQTYKEAMVRSDAAKWDAACKDEI